MKDYYQSYRNKNKEFIWQQIRELRWHRQISTKTYTIKTEEEIKTLNKSKQEIKLMSNQKIPTARHGGQHP